MAHETAYLNWIICIFLSLFISLPLSGQKWERLNRKFDLHYDRAEFSTALEFAQRMQEYAGEKLDSADTRSALSNFYMAKAYEGLGEMRAAREYAGLAYLQLAPNIAYNEAMAEVTRLYGKIEGTLGYHTTAETLLYKAMEISLELDGPESLSYLQSLYAMADLYMARAQWDAMVGILTVALQVHERNFAPDHDYAVYANYLGLLYMNSDFEQEAILYLKKSISAYEKGGVVEDLTCANAHNNLGLIHFYRSEFTDAAEHFEHAGILYRAITEGYSENYMMLLSNRASLYYSWGKPEKTKESYQALGEYLAKYGERMDLPYIQGVENMANFYASDRNFKESEACFLKAIEARKRLVPVDREALLRTIHALISVCEELNQPEKARAYREMAEQE